MKGAEGGPRLEILTTRKHLDIAINEAQACSSFRLFVSTHARFLSRLKHLTHHPRPLPLDSASYEDDDMPRKENPGPISARAQQGLVSEGIENFELPKSVVMKIAKSAVRV